MENKIPWKNIKNTECCRLEKGGLTTNINGLQAYERKQTPAILSEHECGV